MSSSKHQFLFELGTEELPPKSLLTLITELKTKITSSLTNLGVEWSSIKEFATPRRLAIKIDGLPASTPQKSVILWGPPANVAFDSAGKPSKAAEAFAAKNGVAINDLKIANDGKVEKIQCEISTGGEQVNYLLPGIIQDALAQLPIAKRMRWGSKRVEFVRPAQWLVMLWDQAIIPCEILGLKANNQTRGHRFHCDQWLILNNPADYENILQKDGKVQADFTLRRNNIRAQVIAAGEQIKGKAVIDPDLLDEVTALVEWPIALAGKFEERFLSVPAEALISSMKEHQKYFHVESLEGDLLPYFITIANIESLDPAQVIAGNEKVIRPRLSDAAFFFATDKKTSLTQHREKLRNVVFQAQLGTVFEKTERIARLCQTIAETIGANSQLAERAGALSKSDLATAMVYEFADMQGIAGYYYGKNDGENSEVCNALKEQYLPKFAGDNLPQTITGNILALADRLIILAGIFGLGQIPTGSKDPFGLRRASVAVLRILVEKRLNLDLRDLLKQAVAQYPSLPKGDDTVNLALNYMLERFHAWYEEQNIPSVVYQAVAAKGVTNPLDIDNRVQAVAAFYRLPDAEALAAANKRVSNILAKQTDSVNTEINVALLQEPAEKALAEQVIQMQRRVAPLYAKAKYTEALTELASLRESVDRFFAEVMVMAEDPQLRANRLALLTNLRQLFWEVADISQLSITQ